MGKLHSNFTFELQTMKCSVYTQFIVFFRLPILKFKWSCWISFTMDFLCQLWQDHWVKWVFLTLSLRTVAPIANTHIFCASRILPARFLYNVQSCENKILGWQGSKFIFGFGSTCGTRCKFLGAQLKMLGAQLKTLVAPKRKIRKLQTLVSIYLSVCHLLFQSCVSLFLSGSYYMLKITLILVHFLNQPYFSVSGNITFYGSYSSSA